MKATAMMATATAPPPNLATDLVHYVIHFTAGRTGEACEFCAKSAASADSAPQPMTS